MKPLLEASPSDEAALEPQIGTLTFEDSTVPMPGLGWVWHWANEGETFLG